MKNRTVSATEFKAKCLGLLDEIGQRGGTITVTKRGRPVAAVARVRKLHRRSSEGLWQGKVDIPDELLTADTADEWECARQR